MDYMVLKKFIKNIKNKRYKMNFKSQKKEIGGKKKHKTNEIIVLCAFLYSIGCCMTISMEDIKNIFGNNQKLSLIFSVILILILVTIPLALYEIFLMLDYNSKNKLKLFKEEVTEERKNKYYSFVKENSILYREIIYINEKYDFDDKICKKHTHEYICNSKKEFDNFNVDNWMYNQLINKGYYYENFEKVYNENKEKYEKYCLEYKNIEIYRDEESLFKYEIDFDTFHEIEKSMYKQLKKRPICKPEIRLDVYYSSPAGRNNYHSSKVFYYTEIIEYINKADEEIARRLYEAKQKALLTKEDKITYKQLEKKEESIKQRERDIKEKLREIESLDKKKIEIEKKEQEFKAATQGHIYSSTSNIATEIVEENNETEDLDTKLRKLKKSFDNGELTYNEYKEKREKLLEE